MTIWIASRFAPTYQGGLAAYERLLIRALSQRTGFSLSIVCATTHLDFLPAVEVDRAWPIVELEGTWLGQVSRPLWGRLASKVLLHGVLESVLNRSWQRPQSSSPDVIHYIGTGWNFFGFAIAKFARKNQTPFIITPAIHPRSWGSDRIDIRLYHRADRIICFTSQESQSLQQLGLREQKLFVCPLPPMCNSDGDGRRFRNDHHLEERPCVLYIGRRDEGKGYPALLRAWPLVLGAIPDAVLILAGASGEQYRELLARISARNLCDLGIPDEIQKANAIAACDVFCLPSAHESFGIVYVDAWSYGKPVVCGTAPACREFIADGKTGLWASQEPEELADKLIFLLKDGELRKMLGQAGKLEQIQRFNEDTFLRSHLHAFGIPTEVGKDKTPAKPGITV